MPVCAAERRSLLTKRRELWYSRAGDGYDEKTTTDLSKGVPPFAICDAAAYRLRRAVRQTLLQGRRRDGDAAVSGRADRPSCGRSRGTAACRLRRGVRPERKAAVVPDLSVFSGSGAGSCSANRSSSTIFFRAMTNLLSPGDDFFHYTIFPGLWISGGCRSRNPGRNVGSRTFPQGREFSTENYPQMWITLGTSPEIQAGRGFFERLFCGKPSLHLGGEFPIMRSLERRKVPGGQEIRQKEEFL